MAVVGQPSWEDVHNMKIKRRRIRDGHNEAAGLDAFVSELGSGLYPAFTPERIEQMRAKEEGIVLLSLFSGSSADIVILKRLNIAIDTVYTCEISGRANELCRVRHACACQIEQLGDISAITPGILDRLFTNDMLQRLVVTAGSPCQDIARVNTRGCGIWGPKSKLFFDVVKIWKTLNKLVDQRNATLKGDDPILPPYFFFENILPSKETLETMCGCFPGLPVQISDAGLFGPINRCRMTISNIPLGPIPETPCTAVLNDVLCSYPDWVTSEPNKKGNSPRVSANVNMVISTKTNGSSRHLNIVELERAMGFPDGYFSTFHPSGIDVLSFISKQGYWHGDLTALGMIGNSWSIPWGMHHMQALQAVFPSYNHNMPPFYWNRNVEEPPPPVQRHRCKQKSFNISNTNGKVYIPVLEHTFHIIIGMKVRRFFFTPSSGDVMWYIGVVEKQVTPILWYVVYRKYPCGAVSNAELLTRGQIRRYLYTPSMVLHPTIQTNVVDLHTTYIGLRLMRVFGNTPYFGTVAAYFSTKETEGPELWHVLYDDGDEEDLNRDELVIALRHYTML